MSDVKKVREAAQRIIDNLDHFVHPANNDVRALLWAWLAEHPDDDELPTDKSWVEKVSPRGWQTGRDGNQELWIGPAQWHDFSVDGYLIIDHGPHSMGGWHLYTRGDVRRLCRALRVELGEKR